MRNLAYACLTAIIGLNLCMADLAYGMKERTVPSDENENPDKKKVKLIRKGFKPSSTPQRQDRKASLPSKGPLLYDAERDMPYYGKSLSEIRDSSSLALNYQPQVNNIEEVVFTLESEKIKE